MNGAHDMGGTHGFGPVITEDNEPPFHADWEARSLAITLAAGSLGKWNLDQSRFAREDTPPANYLRRTYYEMWYEGLERLLLQHEIVTADEIAAAQRGETFERIAEPPLTADRVPSALARGGKARVDVEVAPLFTVGQSVRAKIMSPQGHTRLPRYVRGRTGVVDRDHGVFIFPDTHAATGDPKPQHIYAVRFEATELWGDDAQGGAVYVDLWDDYLDAAGTTA